MEVVVAQRYERVINDICELDWVNLTQSDLLNVAWAYYYFSIQFRENLEVACELFPDDAKLLQLRREECNTDNLSPWPEVAAVGERMNHDEFMARTLALTLIDAESRASLQSLGQSYLDSVCEAPRLTKALSIASYEDGGLEKVFGAFLTAPHWNNPLLQAFRHFLTEHIRFDSDPEQGHGSLSRHIMPDDRILPLWSAFHHLLVQAAPRLDGGR